MVFKTISTGLPLAYSPLQSGAMTTGRNEPCPCGSGKKYKKCCLKADEAAARPPWQEWHELDKRLLDDVLDYANRHHPEEFQAGVEEFPLDMEKPTGEAVALFYCWMAHAWKFDDKTAAELYLAERGQRLDTREREWMKSSIAAWSSYWEVLEVTPGTSLRLRDLFTGMEKLVSDRGASQSLVPHVVVLARVIDHQGMSLFGATHTRSLPPMAARNLVDELREEFELPKLATPDDMRAGERQLDLIFSFDDEVRELDKPPEITTADGQDLVFTEDKYVLEGKGAKAALVAGVDAWSDVLPRETDDPDEPFVVLAEKLSKKAGPPSILAQIQVKPRKVLVTTIAEARANDMRTRLEKAFPGILRFDQRKIIPADKVGKPRGKKAKASAPSMDSPEMEAVLMDFKAKHYATWPDIELPALDGLTPREAASQPQYRGRIDTLLKDMEVHERQEAPGKRYDFQILRKELGL